MYCTAVKRISISIGHMSFRCENGLPGMKMSLQGDSLFEKKIVENWVEQIVPHQLDMGISVRHGDGLGFIKDLSYST